MRPRQPFGDGGQTSLGDGRKGPAKPRLPAYYTRIIMPKRLFDILVSATLLVLMLPILLIVAAVVRMRLGRPVLFRQHRVGLDEQVFTIWKFRTMRESSYPAGRPLPDSERLTPVGRVLRTTSLDELPTLWNVLRGEMSLVGPRPLLVQYLERYTPEQRRRHQVRPGITGWAQVRGRNELSWEEKLAADVWYVEHRSLLLDLRILARTVRLVLARQGISQPGHATAEEFHGTGNT